MSQSTANCFFCQQIHIFKNHWKNSCTKKTVIQSETASLKDTSQILNACQMSYGDF